MLMQPGAPAQAPSSLQVLGSIVWRLVTTLAVSRAHADIVIRMKDGRVVGVDINQRFLPETLPRG